MLLHSLFIHLHYMFWLYVKLQICLSCVENWLGIIKLEVSFEISHRKKRVQVDKNEGVINFTYIYVLGKMRNLDNIIALKTGDKRCKIVVQRI